MAKCEISHCIEVCLPDAYYPVWITQAGLKDTALLRQNVTSSQVLIISNETIAPLYLNDIKQAFADRQCNEVILKDGEQYKNHAALIEIYDVLVKHRHHRDTTLIALGGGVIGDITGFAAATYQRGVPYIQLPTSLLAQVDASLGGKTAINHQDGKNLIGCFHQPKAVIVDLSTLNTLPEREFNAGLAEVIKYAFISRGAFLEQLSTLLSEGQLRSDKQGLESIVAQCCQIKADIIKTDEKDRGQRALLNLGHTFAHALEAQTGYERWLHGEAVGIGLYCAALLSQSLGHIESKTVKQLESLLKLAHLPHKIPQDIDLRALRERMALDKKVKDRQLNFILMKESGCFISSDVPENSLQQTLLDAVKGE